MREPLVVDTPAGLYSPAGGFHIDPWRTTEFGGEWDDVVPQAE